MQTQQKKINPETSKFLEVIDEIKNTNRLLDANPKTYSAIAGIIYPSDRTIFTKLKKGVRKKIPLDALVNLATYFKVDMNYIFFEGFDMNYFPEIVMNSDNKKTIDTTVSLEQLKTINKNEHNALALAMSLYEKLAKVMEKLELTIENQSVSKIK
ncbi:hypothetical protein GCM10011344_40930 [Dokdonia pacifica]|uniref:Uncharacterized protein n=1 Tax=Dokdonia pacifica TaxID=1627892 RepID=A0A239AAK7_9FLAO|nr:hypothetical protein [Dokdonia pacifica]GGG35842.1 hypothetical protein GCM10011344_40930 [Dokdonia pacifica]SNR92569.1 hypothetical protein SAMN06265376_104279 [Dokdonia pacifica]